jgi:hypothetical protein
VIQRALEETAAIWSPAGVALRSMQADSGVRPVDGLTVRVVVDDDRGQSSAANSAAIGWINFDGASIPEALIHLSHRNVVQLLDASDQNRARPVLQRDLFLGRALGRALAHELGHYLLASKAHTERGLMRGRRWSDEFFSPDRAGFEIGGDERELIVARLRAATGPVPGAIANVPKAGEDDRGQERCPSVTCSAIQVSLTEPRSTLCRRRGQNIATRATTPTRTMMMSQEELRTCTAISIEDCDG